MRTTTKVGMRRTNTTLAMMMMIMMVMMVRAVHNMIHCRACVQPGSA